MNSIGALPEEIFAFKQITVMIAAGYTLLVLSAMIQVVSYYFYNGKFHPFAMIVEPDQKSKFKFTAYVDKSFSNLKFSFRIRYL